jgi:hypothetical protein
MRFPETREESGNWFLLAMRYTFQFALGIFAAIGCTDDVSGAMARTPDIHAPLFSAGSDEQAKLDRFLAKFPAEKAARLRRQFETREAIIAARDPELQREIDAIYEALAEKNAGKLERYTPGPVEAKLIREYLSLLPPDEGNKYIEAAFHASNARVDHHDPAMRKLLDAIYQARKDEARGRRGR